ncbi:DUF5683 domain-containing protein [Pontibacter vulgaris]|uniref:DUF5683 domain-containing protein n=1 Tax=Pontibacter vulgaris TaxID=2905679 RepID=UPI001FA7E24D|nr:DUF5683 domain-containing protein [Pontibacter vulgaris]
MRLASGIVAILTGLLLQLAPHQTLGQVITAGPDSAVVAVPDTAKQRSGFFLSKWDKPAKAALLSAILPGAGQVYNGSFWKLPIIYGTGAVLGYFLIDNNNKYQDYRQALITRNSGRQDKYYNDPTFGVQRSNGTSNLRLQRDGYRRNRDLTVLLSVGAWGLNVAEAYVHAHMKDFDVGENLSLRVQPNLQNIPATAGLTPGLTLTLYTKTK